MAIPGIIIRPMVILPMAIRIMAILFTDSMADTNAAAIGDAITAPHFAIISLMAIAANIIAVMVRMGTRIATITGGTVPMTAGITDIIAIGSFSSGRLAGDV